jgi:hypothetical protein
MTKIKQTCLLLTLLFISLWVTTLYAAAPTKPNPLQQRVETINSLKGEMLLLNRDLSILEQEILYPLLSQFSIYLSTTDKQRFKTGELTVKVDGKTIAEHKYSAKAVKALFNDGIQHLYIGKLKEGKHQLQLNYAWNNEDDTTLKGELTHAFTKEFQAKHLELTIVKKTSKAPSIFKVIEWE